jgi:hypothetical protein
MDTKPTKVQIITPLAILRGGINGTRFIARITMTNGDSRLYSISPPHYKLEEAIPIKHYILESSVAKHGYIPVNYPTITNEKQYKNFLQKINTPTFLK